MAKRTLPTEKQIAYAEEIARTLDLEFPTCATEYTKSAFSAFIQANHSAYNQFVQWMDEDTIMEFCHNDVWCEYY